MSTIKSEMPNVSPAVLALALHEAGWDVTAAVQLVSLFMDVRGRELEELQQVLHRPACPLHSALLYSQAEMLPHGMQSHAASRKDTTHAGAEQASGSDDSSPSRAQQRRKSKAKKDKSKKDKKHNKRRLQRTEKVSQPAIPLAGLCRWCKNILRHVDPCDLHGGGAHQACYVQSTLSCADLLEPTSLWQHITQEPHTRSNQFGKHGIIREADADR